MGTDKCDKWLDAGLGKSVEDFCKGDFGPQNESDIEYHLYHALLEIRQVADS